MTKGLHKYQSVQNKPLRDQLNSICWDEEGGHKLACKTQKVTGSEDRTEVLKHVSIGSQVISDELSYLKTLHLVQIMRYLNTYTGYFERENWDSALNELGQRMAQQEELNQLLMSTPKGKDVVEKVRKYCKMKS